MRIVHYTAILLGSIVGAGAVLAQSLPATEDQPVTVGGIETVCTGTTTDARADPRWRAYSLRIEFVGKDGQYLGDEQVNVSGNGHTVSVHCAGPWVLMKLPSGAYKVSADVADAGHKDLTVHVPAQVIARFPNAGGEALLHGKIAAR